MAGEITEMIALESANLTEVLSTADTKEKQIGVVIDHINHISSSLQSKSVGDFPIGLEWFNLSAPVSLSNELKGKIVVLDFFTYCCINCMHILPDLKLLEEKHSFESGLAVVGVHSAKFDNEKDSENILAALQRYEIFHPVVNDAEGIMWNELAIPCWPTLLILGPGGEPLHMIMGEGKREDLFLFVETAINHYKSLGRVLNHSLPLSPLSRLERNGPLLFPGKVTSCLVEEAGMKRERLAVADTGHHRIIVIKSSGEIEFIVGGTSLGFVDGNLTEAKFHSPQGLAFHGPHMLYVADTENHAIRAVDLKALKVTTVAGTGSQGSDQIGGLKSTEQALSSPWDLVLATSAALTPLALGDGQQTSDVLLIAMAGTHQIWALFLETRSWWKGKRYEKDVCVAIAGNGKEENRNNAYPHAAAFAQPSGLSLSADRSQLFIADSESSSVRQIVLSTGKVAAVAGGDRSPTNLFCFGDVDGKLYDAKLQHPLGVAYCPDGRLFVADSYNHKLKVVDLATNQCTTVLGSGKPGHSLGLFSEPGAVQLSEPGGLCTSCDGTKIYLADTNNHSIKVVHLDKKQLEELTIVHATETDSYKVADKTVELALCSQGGEITLAVAIALSDKIHFTPDAPQKWVVKLPDDMWKAENSSGMYQAESTIVLTASPKESGAVEDVWVEHRLYCCSDNDVCFVKKVDIKVAITYAANAPTKLVQRIEYVVQ